MPERRLLWPLLALGMLLWFLPLNIPVLLHPDEGRYAEVPREMVTSGDWVTPRLDAIKYFEKPPLQYWATAAAFELFGERQWTVRLWPALTGLGGVLLCYALGRFLYGSRTAMLAALIQAGALLYAVLARLAVLDMSVTFALQLTMTALVLLVQPRAAGRRAALLLAIGMTLALLSKGLIGVVIPAAVGAIYMLCYRDWRLPWRARPWWSVLALALIGAPWFILVSRRNPEFAWFFFIHEHFQRFLTTEAQRYQPPWFFVPILVAGFMPWTLLLPQALARAWRAARAGERASAMLLIWAAFVFVFFSLSDSKLVPYILPMLPALALITARSLAELDTKRLAQNLGVCGALPLALALTLVLGAWLYPERLASIPRSLQLEGEALLFAFAACALLAAWLSRRALLPAVALLALAGVGVVQLGFAAYARLPLPRALAAFRALAPTLLTPATHVYCVEDYIQPLTFYLQRPCTLVHYRGELDFGLKQEPWRWIPDLDAFAARWRGEHDALALIAPENLPALRALGLPMRVIYTSQSFVAVSRQ